MLTEVQEDTRRQMKAICGGGAEGGEGTDGKCMKATLPLSLSFSGEVRESVYHG